MIKLNPYLNFDGKTEEAFLFYHSVFGGELTIQKVGDTPIGKDSIEEERNRVIHAGLSIGDDQFLMASDCSSHQDHELTIGNNTYISITPDSREEADRLFQALSAEGTIEMPMADMFWGDYFGSFVDKFGVCWMINYVNSK